jgi:hypothetical protein
VGERFDLPDFIMDFTSLMPNKSPEPTAVTHGSCPRDRGFFHIVNRRWLSFFR